jgi:tRNA nucleotidyltransferase (CCA-adding enzyme)
MTRLSRVMERATPLVLPTPEEQARVGGLAARLLKTTREAASRYPETRGALLGGSFAKGTWLPRHVDLDIFVKFDPAVPDERFEELGLAVGSSATEGHPRGKKYAQHPYTEATVDAVRVNIVPCFDVQKGRWRSAADRSPFHVRLVKRLPEGTKTDIRLLKRFMRAVGVYGAEIQTQGFSGYAAEVLVMKLGSLEAVLRWFADLHPHSEDRLLTLADPVDGARDLSVAISNEKLARMVLASREFLRDPALAYFNKLTAKARRPLANQVVAVVFTHRRMSEDTLWGELRKTMKHIVRHLEVHGFKVARHLAASDNATRSAILLVPEFAALPEFEQRVGPTVERRKDVEAFVASNRRSSKLIWVDDDARVRLLRPRKYLRLDDLLEDVARGRTGPTGASPELGRGMKRSALVLQGTALRRAASSSKWLSDGISEIVTDVIGTRGP